MRGVLEMCRSNGLRLHVQARNESIIEYILRLVESIESRLRSALRQQMCELRNDGAESNKLCIAKHAGESSKVIKTRLTKTRTGHVLTDLAAMSTDMLSCTVEQ